LVFWVPVLLQNSSFCFAFQGSCAPPEVGGGGGRGSGSVLLLWSIVCCNGRTRQEKDLGCDGGRFGERESRVSEEESWDCVYVLFLGF
jgi:hypothetical protein